MVSGSVEDLSMGQWSVGRLGTCWWVSGRFSVVGGLSVVAGFVICRETCRLQYQESVTMNIRNKTGIKLRLKPCSNLDNSLSHEL